ncbi:bifunctional proline dehydrogenase/L-glutamate gamma-semialdehyde dehydrogenase PutA [Rhodoplanes sp. Z2-YC6860]|uniref:bifunctional proline dehydrogenase/L-glutamate gamma-semialdehyde dehydrogenase PutA n=1 Tax=Rhodoplanes sp. Z2-YC6860 TaxID=674703 RepID=UPI00078E3F1A|nr:bifunctional proline dehydrogenase/L-glutamate gamma-semialdehyde dehydrogenase PutA [Rhodoplanes sp. Z2-YC6860]AMN44518.1 delta-1-pyrroline-5-carboxylate dehydrogenase [Rhodoplanes sp. Z2-YC6860]
MSDKPGGRSEPPAFAAPYAPPDRDLARRLLAAAFRDDGAEARIDARARSLIEAIRDHAGGLGGIEDFLHAYSLSTKEGLALMVLAEALLRIPDGATADALIEDKLAAGDWSEPDTSGTLLVSASAWTLGVTARVIQPGETPENIVDSLLKRLGVPTVRLATRQAMRLLGSHFVLGQTIEEALSRAGSHREFRYSFDMLGEGARTGADAARYFEAYADAIAAIGARAGNARLPARPGISVKLSALHPRYEAVSRERVMKELVPRALELARLAKRHDLNFTIDAEEADRLELSLDVVGKVLADPSLAGWDGFGLAVQAYQKRAGAAISWLDNAAHALGRRLMVRLVKGAYWDTEVKRAQERGLADYPVFTRKAMTDLSYMACLRQLLAARPRLYPQFATHNALTVASVIEEAGGVEGYEFQRLHGMGEVLYEKLLEDLPDAACRVYAPVGSHRDLLAYLVRRLLENGANSSFVAVAADPKVPVEDILKRPQAWIMGPEQARHPHIPLPRDLYRPARLNSSGVEFGDRAALAALQGEIVAAVPKDAKAAPLIDGKAAPGTMRQVLSPIDGAVVGQVTEADAATAAKAMAAAHAGLAAWNATPVEHRADVLERAGELLEASRGRLIALMQAEGGKTLDDALSELREAVDYCRYYAAQARQTLVPHAMPGPTGESNELRHRGRGVFVCISPWNFPLAIFLGQVTAALAAGNAVVAKPAEQTPLVAAEAIRILHQAGVPVSALQFVPGYGDVGAALTADLRVAGVAFTGSTEVGRIINRALAKKDGPIVPLIAETGGINAMIVDATALPEQVTDDVVMSAFRSAGQRCSALRLLCVQEDVADRIVEMIAGAARELALGDPRDPATHVGPVIDEDAKQKLDGWLKAMAAQKRVIFRWDESRALPARGLFVPPSMIRLDRASDLKEEVFGPILHVVRWRADRLDQLLDDIAGNGTGLTLGVHSRIDSVADKIIARLANGNVYINRSIIGAVVGTQPFGGTGLSGTGPKAGGPNYVRRFATEQTVTVNTAAAGGNATLLSENEQ